LVADTRHVLEAIVSVARQNHRPGRPDVQEKVKPSENDKLTELYVRAGAKAGAEAGGQEHAKATMIALAIGLDRSDLLRKYPVLGDFVKRVESDRQREDRLENLGKPTMHGRYDLTQHFVVSAAITAMAGAKSAEAVGLAKERRDSEGGSGFSCADWCADVAGASLASRILANEISLSKLAKSFRVSHYMPDIAGLPEDLTRQEFTRRFGSTTDARFRQVDADIRSRIQRLYQPGINETPR
jgi:hypothetical protein